MISYQKLGGLTFSKVRRAARAKGYEILDTPHVNSRRTFATVKVQAWDPDVELPTTALFMIDEGYPEGRCYLPPCGKPKEYFGGIKGTQLSMMALM